MQRPPPRIKMHKSNSQKHLQVCSLVPANVIVLTIVLAQLMVLTHPTWAWQYADNQQVFPNRHPDFYHPPSNPITSNQFSLNTQNLYNQPLNSPLQQQFLTPTSSNNGQPPPTASDQLASSEPFSALFAPNSRISSSPATTSEQQQQHQPIVAAAASDASANSVHEQPINARDTSQQAKPIDTTNSQIKSNQEHDDHQHSSSGKQDHDVVVQSPSPLGKILDVVARETVSALSSSIAASKETSATTTTTKDAKQQTTTVAEGKVTHATKSESDSGGSGKRQANEQVLLHLKPLTQAVAMAAQQAKTKKSDKNSVNSIEQQIINQHARATSYATLHSRRYEPPQQQQSQTTAATVPQQLVRLLPTKHRGDTKLFSNLLSTLSGHNSAASGGGDADSSSSQSGGSGGQLASLVDNFKSGISSRSSLVKAAISDNKLARTLSTVGKTIGGNKYVASAGAAAALAALGLTVSKFLSPYVMAGSYSKLGGAGPMDPLVAAGSYLQPSYMTTGGGGGGYGPGPDRNFHYLPTSDSMLAAAATNNNQQYLDSAQFDPNAMSQLQSAFNSYASQQQPDQLTSSPTGTGNFYAAYRPSSGTTTGSLSSQQKNAASFDGGANGHYSSFYSSQPEYEQQNGSGGLVDMSGQQQQFGSYISGAPTSGGFAAGQQYGTVATSLPAGSSSGGDPTGYFSSDQTDLSSAVSATGNTYEPTLGQQQQYDQIMSSASSDTPTYANNLLGPQPQPPSRVSFPKSATSAGSWAAGRAPQHRSGAVVLKLDEATRNLIRQQLQAELAARAASTNYNYLTLNSASRSGGSGTGADQSSGEMTATSGSEFTATPPVVSMTDQRVGAADSSGDYATFVQWQPQSSSIVAQAQQQQGGGVRSGTIKSNYNGAQQSTGQTWPHLRQQGQFVVAGAGGQQADKKLQLANYNSIRPQMQTRRNEPSAAASNAHVLIRPNTMRPHTAPPPPPPVDSSPASRKPGQQLARAQPQLVPIVGTSTRSLSSTATQWNSVQASKQADQMAAGDKKLPAATVGSLDLPQASGATAAEFANDDDPKTSTSGLSLNRAARNPQAAGRMAAPEAERANNSWLVPAIDQQSLLRDYEVLAAAQQQQQQPPVDGVSPQQVSGKSGHSTTTASQQDDELLQVASSMRANLIQSSDGDRPQSSTDATDGAEYQLDTLDGGGEIEENNNSTSDNKTGQEGNKLIEAKTNTNNAAIVVADGSGGGKRSSGQHDKRHRSHSPSMSSQQQQQHRATATAGEGDNVPASVVSATEQRQEQVTLLPPATTTATTVDQQQQTLSSRLSQVVGGGDDDEDQTKYRAFRGIVAGGLGGAGH